VEHTDRKIIGARFVKQLCALNIFGLKELSDGHLLVNIADDV
jgi:hypothetical protein